MLICGDALTVMNKMRPRSADLVFTSPPYEDCRTYGIGFNLKGQEWVDWCVAWITAAKKRGIIVNGAAGLGSGGNMRIIRIGSSIDNPGSCNDIDLLLITNKPVDICVYTPEDWEDFKRTGISSKGHRVVIHPRKIKTFPATSKEIR
jgi:hypothetical protein